MEDMEILNIFHDFLAQPFVLAWLIFFCTFILEDPTTLSAALLASYGHIPPMWGFCALLGGIILSDLGLYGLGYGANHFQWAKKIQATKGASALDTMIKNRLITAVLIARCIPGVRITTYMTIGFFKLSFLKYVFAVICASVLWTTILYWSIYAFGQDILDILGPYQWPLLGGLIAVLIFGPKFWGRKKQNDSAA